LKFFSTNPDKATMMMGYRMPGCGSMVKSIEVSSNRESEVIGKPNPFVL
jgi:ribonucleotide monophosphatase NagD (HAD superfamily)